MSQTPLVLELERFAYTGVGTYGRLLGTDLGTIWTIEKLWSDNQVNKSCIPEGTYRVELEYSPKFEQELYTLRRVKGRTYIRIHPENYPNRLLGCLALGSHLDVLEDSKVRRGLPNAFPCAMNSQVTVQAFMDWLDGRPFELRISYVPRSFFELDLFRGGLDANGRPKEADGDRCQRLMPWLGELTHGSMMAMTTPGSAAHG